MLPTPCIFVYTVQEILFGLYKHAAFSETDRTETKIHGVLKLLDIQAL